jgi:hypothetical protein
VGLAFGLRLSAGLAKVRHLDQSIRGHQGVAGFDVLMNQPPLVSGVQAPGELNSYIKDLLQARKLPRADQALQGTALQELGEDGNLIVHRAEEPAGGQVRMLGQIDPGLQLGQEAAPVGLVADQGSLHGKAAAGGAAPQQIDLAHAALAQLPLDHEVVQDPLPLGPHGLVRGPSTLILPPAEQTREPALLRCHTGLLRDDARQCLALPSATLIGSDPKSGKIFRHRRAGIPSARTIESATGR